MWWNPNRKILCVLLTFVGCMVMAWAAFAQGQTEQLLVMHIILDENQTLVEKEYATASVMLQYPGQTNSGTFSMAIRQRGNSTFNYDKKSYKIKLDDAYDFLSEEGAHSDDAARDWILLANYFDKTGLRNTYAFTAASALSGIEYVSQSVLVEVYFDDEYQGVYQLCEAVEVNEARLAIDDEMLGDNGVLLECRQSLEKEYGIGLVYGECEYLMFDICSDITNEAQVTRAKEVLQTANEAILSGDQKAVSAVLDLDSCVDMYLLQEFLMNIDVGFSSFYVYLKQNEDVVYFGPPWDFDISMGSSPNYETYQGLFAASRDFNVQKNPNEWFRDLMDQPWFQDLVRARWNEKKDVFLQALVTTQQLEQTYRQAFAQNDSLWYTPEELSPEEWPAYYAQQDTALYEWIQNRYNWLDIYFNEEM